MSLKKILSFLSLGILFAALITIFFSFRGGSGVGRAEGDEIIGKELRYKVYEFNKLAAEITSSSSKRDFDKSRKPAHRERTLLADIKGIIYKSKKFSNDIRFTGNSGYIENENKNFLLQGDAKIGSKEVTLTSDRFFMEGSSLISNDSVTDFKLKNLKGVARKGISYHMEIGVVNLFKASGTYIRSGKEYHFRCNRLMVLNKLNRVVFRGNAHIQGNDSTMKGKEIILRFNKDFKNLKRTDLRGKGYFFTKLKKRGEFRELRGNKIIASFDKDENIKKVDIAKNGIINISQSGSKMRAESDLIYIRFDPVSKNLSHVKLMEKGKVTSSGKNPFRISAGRIRVIYGEKGDIEYCNSKIDVKMTIRKLKSECRSMTYYPGKDMVTMSGKKAFLTKGENKFLSRKFIVDTKKEKLFSEDEITSTIYLESGNSIFSKSPVFISSKKVEIYEKSGTIIYSEDVSLFQGDTKLNAEKVEIGNNKSINISGKAKLNFMNGEKNISIGGNEIKIDPTQNSLYIDGEGMISEEENSLSGKSLIVEFDDNNQISRVTGKNEIEFKRKGISGKSEKVVWKFSEKIITFINNAQLIKTDSGRSKGAEIQFSIEDEKVLIKSAEGKRSETKID